LKSRELLMRSCGQFADSNRAMILTSSSLDAIASLFYFAAPKMPDTIESPIKQGPLGFLAARLSQRYAKIQYRAPRVAHLIQQHDRHEQYDGDIGSSCC
jgi:hypothetical protein